MIAFKACQKYVLLVLLLIFWSIVPVYIIAQNPVPTAMVWLSTDCPLSQKYTRTLSLLEQNYSDKSVQWKAIFVNEKIKSVKRFLEKYSLTMPYILDENKMITTRYKATITPEVVLVVDEKIVYRGAIDNQVLALGKFADSATAHYLQVAIDSILSGKIIAIPNTQAIGCIIQ